MMVLLSFNILYDAFFLRLRMCKRSVPLLPLDKSRKNALLSDPMPGRPLDGFDQIRKADRGVEVAEYMKMVFNAIDAEQMASLILNNSPYIAK